MQAFQGLELCDEIVETIDELPEGARRQAEEFFESVRDGAISIQEKIHSQGYVTEGQAKALRNWLAGVQKWLE